MTSSMVISSVLWMEGVGLGLARNIVQRYALEPTRHKNKRPTLCGVLPGELFAETTRRPGDQHPLSLQVLHCFLPFFKFRTELSPRLMCAIPVTTGSSGRLLATSLSCCKPSYACGKGNMRAKPIAL
jgi:hypothetical protein